MNSLLIDYISKFGETPPSIMMIDFDDPIYLKLMRVALDTGLQITLEDLEKEMERQNIVFDLGE